MNIRRTGQVVAFIVALALLALATPVAAETLTAVVPLSPANEVPPIPPVNASGTAVVTINITRNSAGNITSATINFMVSFNFPSSITVTGLHIHEGSSTVAGPVRFDTGLSGASSITFPTGNGSLDLTVFGVDPVVLQRLINNPAGFYVNLHTTVNPGGVIRGQITKLTETLAAAVTMTSAEEVPPVVGLNASAASTIIVNPTRNSNGVVTGGTVTFVVNFNFPGPVTVTGLHIHEAARGANGTIFIPTSVSGANPVVSSTGAGTINLTVFIGSGLFTPAVVQRLLANPANFYVNLHTQVNPGGAIRAQLSSLTPAPPAILTSSNYVLATSGNPATITLSGASFEPNSRVLINGTAVNSTFDFFTGQLTVTVPASLLASAGVLNVQVQNSAGLRSNAQAIIVADAAKTNSQAAVTVDAARFGANVAPDEIVALFGTQLATQTASATISPLTTTLGGTTVFVNGEAAQLFFVSAGQINFLIPADIPVGTAKVVVVSGDGTVSQGNLTVAATAPGIFTVKGDGTGAPAALASTDGANFNILLFNLDGTPRQIDLGTTGVFVALFGTGIRNAPNSDGSSLNGVAESVSISLGGTNITPTFAGAQGSFAGLDQINFQIPTSFAGKGAVDLIVTVDGKAANTVKVNIK